MKIVKYGAAAALLVSLGTASLAFDANAASKEYNSTGKLKLISDNTPNPPVDPTDPTKPIEPVDPGEGGTTGPLSIDFASNLDFGEQVISTKSETYKALPMKVKAGGTNTEDRPNYVQITDKRGGQKGWTLSVAQESQFKTLASEGVAAGIPLSGAQITFKNATPVKPTTSEATTPGFAKNEFTLDAETGASVPIFAAAEGEGGGTWIDSFGNLDTMAESIELLVPGGSVKQQAEYQTKLVWSLSDQPAN